LLVVHLVCTPWMRIAYMAPIVGSLLIVMVSGFRILWAWRVSKLPAGRVALIIIVALQVLATAKLLNLERARAASTHGDFRADLLKRLERQPGRHLVFIRYGPRHHALAEWVFNDADPANSRVIFARYLDPASNRAVIAAFPGRRVWGLDADLPGAEPTEFPATAPAAP